MHRTVFQKLPMTAIHEQVRTLALVLGLPCPVQSQAIFRRKAPPQTTEPVPNSSNKPRARCHWPRRSQAEIAALNENASRWRRRALSAASKRKACCHSAAFSQALMVELKLTTSNCAVKTRKPARKTKQGSDTYLKPMRGRLRNTGRVSEFLGKHQCVPRMFCINHAYKFYRAKFTVRQAIDQWPHSALSIVVMTLQWLLFANCFFLNNSWTRLNQTPAWRSRTSAAQRRCKALCQPVHSTFMETPVARKSKFPEDMFYLVPS